MSEQELPDDDPHNPKTFIERFKRPTPGETILAMLADPTMTCYVRQTRMTGASVQLDISGSDWHTHQFLDALVRHQAEQSNPEAATRYVALLRDIERLNEELGRTGSLLPGYLRGELKLKARKP